MQRGHGEHGRLAGVGFAKTKQVKHGHEGRDREAGPAAAVAQRARQVSVRRPPCCIFGHGPGCFPAPAARVSDQQEQIADFYDEFAARQRRTGLNARIWHLYERLRTRGLAPDSRVLELGCGVGALTFLLARHAVRGAVEAVDLSPESVRFAREQLTGYPNVSLHVHDVVTYEPTGEPTRPDFDFITLFDVIEHIPLLLHAELFRHLASLTGPQTQLLLNIPHPRLIEHYHRHEPAELQVVDQSVELAPLVQHLYAAGLTLYSLDTYSLWREDDYQFLVIKPAADFTNRPAQPSSALNRAWGRAQRAWRGLTARYPH